ncbi:MAG: outer membrane lipoprotein-sorting protein, partial [Bacteroidota bacterium]|nr:outer membrane lipoprotein-sorting protein [Bacteroidota bacterium]
MKRLYSITSIGITGFCKIHRSLLCLKIRRNTWLAGILLLLAGLSQAHAQQAKDIARRSYDVISLESMEMKATLSIYDSKNHVRTRNISNVTKTFDGVIKTKLTCLAPPDVAGTTMLIFDYPDKDDDMWIYLPSLRSTRRIVSREKKSSFMGSEFSHADMSKPNLDDYTYSLLGSKDIDGKDCWMVEAVCKSGAVTEANGFNRKLAYIDKKSGLAYRMDYYKADHVWTKTMILKDYRKVSGESNFACYMEMQNR